MPFNLNKVGTPLAIIKDKDSKTLNNKIVSVLAEDNDGDNAYETGKEFNTIHLKTGKFQPIGDYSKERTVNYIVGASGSGKSFFIKEWLKEYKRKYKDNAIFLFSSLSDDKTIDEIKPQRIILDDMFVSEEIDLKMYENSCCVFDDCDGLTGKLGKKVFELQSLMLTTGRHHNISVWVVNHVPTKGKETKLILCEAHTFVFFTANMNRTLVYCLENYVGIDREELKKIKKLKSRWVSIYKHHPQTVITERDLYLLNSDELND